MSDLKSLHITVSGRVQGVGFRFYTQNIASRIGVSGYVKNLYNGDVEIYAEGNEFELKQFLEEVKEGPSISRVLNIRYEWDDIKKRRFEKFGIDF